MTIPYEGPVSVRQPGPSVLPERPRPDVAIDDVATLAATLDGVRRSLRDGYAEWRYRGRLVARQTDDECLVIRCDFDYRDQLLRALPGTFSVPPRYQKHMMIVADLAVGDRGAIEDAIEAAWVLQRRN
jgi:hypothetical protein